MQSDNLSTNQLQIVARINQSEGNFYDFIKAKYSHIATRSSFSFAATYFVFIELIVASPPLRDLKANYRTIQKSINRYVSREYHIFLIFIWLHMIGGGVLWLQFATILLTRPNLRLNYIAFQLLLIHVQITHSSLLLFLLFRRIPKLTVYAKYLYLLMVSCHVCHDLNLFNELD